MLICIQDNNAANNLAAGQNGLKPITSFAAGFSSGASDLASYIQNLYVSFPELGYQFPNPTYAFTGLSSAGAKTDWERAYQDMVTICRGSSGGYEGAIPFGCGDTGVKSPILTPLQSVTPVMQIGNGPANPQAYWNVSAATSAVAATVGAQTALFGWLGRCPGPIFAVPVIRQPDKLVTNANLNIVFNGTVTSVLVYVIMQYSMALAVEKGGDGKYRYEIVRGL